MKKLSVIIVSYNVEHFLQLCLQSVLQATKNIDAEVIVIDNHSSDGSCERIKLNFPEVILVENKVNVGFSKANNHGVLLANGEYVLILNPDTVVAEDCFEKMISFANQQENLGALGVQLIDGTGTYLPESKRNIPTPINALHKLLSNSNQKLNYYANQINEFEEAEVPILSGAFMLLKKDIYIKVGGFDERYFMYGEDIDLCYALLQKGYKNYYFGTLTALHFKGESTQKDVKYLKYFYGAMKIFYNKHMKINKIYDFFMNFGISFWYWIKYFDLLFFKEKVAVIQKVLYVGTDVDIFSKLQLIYPTSQMFNFPICTTRTVSRFDDLAHLNRLIDEHQIQAIIFDTNNLTFSKIIFYTAQLHKKGLIFKIKPLNADYIIGSNCAAAKGIVDKL